MIKMLIPFFVFLFGIIQASENPKTLVLIICSDDLPVYFGLQNIWRSYMHLDPERFECYFIRGNPNLKTEFKIENDVIWSKTEENLIPGILNKTILSLAALQPRLHNFDYVLRSNLSSFFVFPRLFEFLKQAPKENFYCGIHHGYGSYILNEGWICGAGIIMSIDLANLLLRKKSSLIDLNHHHNDDIVIAELFLKHDIKMHSGKYLEIYNWETWERVKDNIPEDVFHFRIKTPPSSRVELDLSIHHTLLDMFYNK